MKQLFKSNFAQLLQLFFDFFLTLDKIPENQLLRPEKKQVTLALLNLLVLFGLCSLAQA
jgi:hypothetical protein